MPRSILFLVLLVTACVSWRAEPTSPAELVANEKPNLVRITRSDSSRLILQDPTVEGDTLYGRPLANLEAEPEERGGIPPYGVLCIGAEAFGCNDEDTSFAPAVNLGPRRMD